MPFVSAIHFICEEPGSKKDVNESYYGHKISFKKNAATQKVDLRMSGLGMSNYSEWVASLG